jgi:Domain of unknown function (DUF4157)
MPALSPPRPILPTRAILPARPILAAQPILPAGAGRRGGVIQGAFLGGQPRLTMIAPRAATGTGTGSVQRSTPAPAANATPMPLGFDGFRSVMPAQRMPEVIQRKMESLFKTSFSDVRIHVGPQAGSIGAQAFTQGSDIFFAHGQYNPSTSQGQRLLGQQLAHVVQQRTGRARNPFGSGLAVVTDPLLKSEAEMMGHRAAMPQPAQPKLAGAKDGTAGRPQVPAPILPKRAGADAAASRTVAPSGAIRPATSGPILPKRVDSPALAPILPTRPNSATSMASPTRPNSATSGTGAILPSRPSAALQPSGPILPGRPSWWQQAAQPMMALGAAVTVGRHVVNSVGRWMFGS